MKVYYCHLVDPYLCHTSYIQFVITNKMIKCWFSIADGMGIYNAHLSRAGLLKDPSLSLARCFRRLSCTSLPLPPVLFVLMSNLFPMHFWMLCIWLKTLVPALDHLYIICSLLIPNAIILDHTSKSMLKRPKLLSWVEAMDLKKFPM